MLVDSLAKVAKDLPIIKEVIVNVADTVTNFVYIKEVPVSDSWSADTWMNFWGVIATFIAVVIALFGEKIKHLFNNVNIIVEKDNEYKVATKFEKYNNPVPHIYFLLKVRNVNIRNRVENAKINVTRINSKVNKNIKEVKFNGELVLKWLTINDDKIKVSFKKNSLFILGYHDSHYPDSPFFPLVAKSNSVENIHCDINESYIYELDISADNKSSNKKFYIQVLNSGEVHKQLSIMINHVDMIIVDHFNDFIDPVNHFKIKKEDKKS